MNEIDLSVEIPGIANSIEISVSTTPAGGIVAVFRSRDDDDPLLMPDGAETIIGAPENRKLYLVPQTPMQSCRLEVKRWFT